MELIEILRVLSVGAFTIVQTILYERLYRPKFEKWQSHAVIALYSFWMCFCNEFLFTNGYVVLTQAVITLAFLQIVFQDGLIQNYIQLNCIMIIQTAILFLFGGSIGMLYRWITGTDNPLWLFGKNLAPIGFFFLLIYLGIVVGACAFLVPRLIKMISRWRKSVLRILFGICLEMEIVNICLTFPFANFEGLQGYVVTYGILLAFIVLVTLISVVCMIKSAQRKRVENWLLEAKMEEQYMQYQFVTLLQQEIREIRHDLKNHLAASGGGISENDLEFLR